MIRSAASEKALRRAEEVKRIGERAVRVAQEESRRLGVPNVYSIEGVLYWELPNGELSERDPYEAPSPLPQNQSVRSAEVSRQALMRELLLRHQISSLSDYAEQIVAEALHGERKESGVSKGYDLTAPGFGRVEVKFRRLPSDGRIEERVALSDAKKDGFDYLAIVIFEVDIRVKGAVLVPYLEAWKFIQQSDYNRMSYSQACTSKGAINITAEVAAAAER